MLVHVPLRAICFQVALAMRIENILKKNTQMNKKYVIGGGAFFTTALVVAIVVVLLAESSQGNISMKVSSLKDGKLSHSFGSLASTSKPSEAIKSSTAFSFMVLDGFKVTISDLSMYDGEESGNNAWKSVGTFKETEVVFGREGTDSDTPVELSANIPVGSYIGANVEMKKGVSAKGFCRTATNFLYTSASGVKLISPDNVGETLPEDYDYYSWSPNYGTAGGGMFLGVVRPHRADNMNAFFFYDVEVTSNVTSMRLMMDSTFLFTCYDGTLPDLNAENMHTNSILDPFFYTHYQTNEKLYDPKVPAVGLVYLPMFLWVGDDANNTQLPYGETYVVTDQGPESIVNFVAGSDGENGEGADFYNIGIVTMVFNPDNTIYSAQMRNSQIWTGFVENIGPDPARNNTYELHLGGNHYYEYGVEKVDRIVTNFTRLDDYTTIEAVHMKDGPDCGTEWKNGVKSCYGTDSVVYMKRLQRE